MTSARYEGDPQRIHRIDEERIRSARHGFFINNVVTGGGSSTATFKTNGPVPPGGATVSIVDNSVKITTPSSMNMAAGMTQKDFNVSTLPVTSTVNCTIRATYNGASGTAVLTVNP